MENFWDIRYNTDEFVYGKSPNVFYKQVIDTLSPGKILLPAEGEGRNSVYAAQKQWVADAFDQSAAGIEKAKQLASEFDVSVNYVQGDMRHNPFSGNDYDAVALIFAHWLEADRAQFHQSLVQVLKPGGVIILEGFSKKNLEYASKNPQVGGPKDVAMLFSKEDIRKDFEQLEIIHLEETEITLSEGEHHKGIGHVVRFVGRKTKP
ncbi:MAG: class I SAM-dependent methyltransferase [Chitinophagales bacterium]|nr:class I SAM-dependent methyltransferase [Chitinophagales bacterium]